MEKVQSLNTVEMLRVESNDGFEGPYFELMTIGNFGFQELVWRISVDDLDYWKIYSMVSNIHGFNALIASDPVDVQWESEESIGAYEQAGKSHAHLGKINDLDFGGSKIDTSTNYGRRAMFPGFWLHAPWQCCYAGAALGILGKRRLLGLPGIFEARLLEDGAVYLKLFDDPFSASKPENRYHQRRFREWLGLDVLESVANYRASDKADPVFEIEEGEFAHGGVRLFRRWIDGNGKPIRRSLATTMEEVELDQKGRVVWQTL